MRRGSHPMPDLSYPAIKTLIAHHMPAGRTESRAFLAWFLEHYYRLEDSEAHDAICDGLDDKGIDGIFVDKNLERIDVFQARMVQNPAKTIGDTALKEFAGTLDQLRTKALVDQVAATTKNKELASLLRDAGVAALVGQGFEIHGVFLTNIASHVSAATYVGARNDMALYDATVLTADYVESGPSDPIDSPFTFSLGTYDLIEHKTGEATAYVAPLLAKDLVQLGGISSGRLFDWNVRQTLGHTRVNKDIRDSVKEHAEHKNFLLYHNGLTVLCGDVKRTKDKLTINKYAVVNGCQSLTTLHDNKADLTDELRLLTRLVELKPGSELAAKITRHSNNQNPISARDLQSNSTIQRRLQADFEHHYKGAVGYEIKRGEASKEPLAIANDAAARILLAFDIEQPWACHQTYRLFDDLHAPIFGRPEVDADRILALYEAHEAVIQALKQLNNKLMESYRLTRYFFLFLLRQALATEPAGIEFIKDPGSFLAEKDGLKRVRRCCELVLGDLVVDLNAELKEREDANNPIDFKRELKSPTAVRQLAQQVVPLYEKAVKRGRVKSFTAEWSGK
jgi:hypothetical protein